MYQILIDAQTTRSPIERNSHTYVLALQMKLLLVGGDFDYSISKASYGKRV